MTASRPMSVAFRVDASHDFGTGHVMRCLTLADALSANGTRCEFICREHTGNMIDHIRNKSYAVHSLPVGKDADTDLAHSPWLGATQAQDAQTCAPIMAKLQPDWLVVDHYAQDARWETSLRPYVRHLMVIDDLADRPHGCDFLLDQNFYKEMTSRYLGLVPAACEMLLGAAYVLLRPEFMGTLPRARQRDGSIRRILVFFGGSDPTNQTKNVLVALGMLNLRDIAVDVVIGSSNPHRLQLQDLIRYLPNVALHCQVSNMAELIARADLGIGAGGIAMWERCYLGLSTITVVFADNQVRTTEDVAGLGAIKYLGVCNSFTDYEYKEAIKEMIDSPGEVRRMAEISQGLVFPGTQRVADVMESIYRTSSW